MARILIRQAHGGATRIISDPALPYFLNQGWVVLDTLDDDTDASPLYLSAAESDLRYARIADLGDPESAEVAVISEAVADSEALRAALGLLFAARRGVLAPFATRSKVPNVLLGLSNGTDTAGNYVTAHTILRAVTGVRVRFPNYYNNGGLEADGPSTITVRAALAFDAGDGLGMGYLPLWFNGKRDVAIEPGASAQTDRLPIDLPAGTVAYIRTFVTVASGGKWPLGMVVRAAGEGAEHGTSVTDKTLSGTVPSVNESMYTGTLLGTPVNPGSAVAIIGDSIPDGIGDDVPDKGWADRALTAANLPFQSIAIPSELANNFAQRKARRRRLSAIEGCTAAISTLGINDFISTFTNAQTQSSSVKVWRMLANMGLKTWATTITPRTSSTDSWATTGNQTSNLSSGRETDRVAFNTWLRAGAPLNATTLAPVAIGTAGALVAGSAGHPLVGYIDVADVVESARNSGLWKPGYTADGTHPSSTAHAAIAGIVPISALAAT